MANERNRTMPSPPLFGINMQAARISAQNSKQMSSEVSKLALSYLPTTIYTVKRGKHYGTLCNSDNKKVHTHSSRLQTKKKLDNILFDMHY